MNRAQLNLRRFSLATAGIPVVSLVLLMAMGIALAQAPTTKKSKRRSPPKPALVGGAKTAPVAARRGPAEEAPPVLLALAPARGGLTATSRPVLYFYISK